MASRLLRASYRMVKLMTEIELNEKITNLLSENPTQQKQSRRPYARENRVKKDDRLLRIIQRYYIPHAGYVDCGFDSTTLLHSGKYIKYPKHSHCQRWMKRLTSKKTRRCTDLSFVILLCATNRICSSLVGFKFFPHRGHERGAQRKSFVGSIQLSQAALRQGR